MKEASLQKKKAPLVQTNGALKLREVDNLVRKQSLEIKLVIVFVVITCMAVFNIDVKILSYAKE